MQSTPIALKQARRDLKRACRRNDTYGQVNALARSVRELEAAYGRPVRTFVAWDQRGTDLRAPFLPQVFKVNVRGYEGCASLAAA